jgi:roadblock/LC7 domain-containing protein
MLAEMMTAFSSLKTVSDFATFVLNARVDAAVREKAIESQAAIVAAQSAMLNLQAQHQELLSQKDELKKQLMEMENWDAEATKYSLTDLGGGVFVYALKSDQTATQPMHYICSVCYQERKKSILQQSGKTMGGVPYACFRCKNTVWVE